MTTNQAAVLGTTATGTRSLRDEGLVAEVRRWVRWVLGHGLPGLLLRGPARRGELQASLLFPPHRVHPEDLAPTYAEIRERGMFYSGSYGLVTAHHGACREVLTSGDFVAAPPSLGRWADWLEAKVATEVFHPLKPPSLLAVGPPEHTRYRSLVSRAFTLPAVRALRGGIEDISVELLDGFEPGEELDLVRRYCRPMPVTLVCDMLGIPLDEIGHIEEMGGRIGLAFDVASSWRDFREAEGVLAAFDSFVRGHVEALRARPGPDLLSRLIAVEDDGDRLSERELVSFTALVFSAGFETTVNLIGSGIKLLCDHPDQLALLREQPDLWPNAVDEILRLDPPAPLTSRVAARDTEVAGHPIAAGTAITVLLAGANRDPALFAQPDRMDVTRPNARDHLSFSAGRHYCFGAVLGRMEGTIALRELLEAYDVELLPGARRRATRVLRGWDRLPAVVTKR